MDMETSRTLTKVLGKRDIDKIPADVLKKLEKYCENNNEQFIQTKVLYNTTQKNIEKLRKEYEKLLSTTQDTTAKKDAAQVNVTELRHQLDTANAEVARLTRQVANQEAETIAYRKECNQLIDEKDQLMKSSAGKDITINHLQSDLKSLRSEFKSAVSEKNDAITRFAEMAAKEQSMDEREKRMEKEIERLNNEIVKMTDNYNKASLELATAKENNTSATAQLEIDLKEKIEELLIAEFTIRQLTESNQQLTNQRDTETVQLKNQLIESVALMEHYKRELDAKIKLVDLHKSNFDECKAQTTEVRLEAESLNQIVKETTEKCEQLEKNLNDAGQKHQSELTEKDTTIEQLKKELKAAGELLKAAETEQIEQVLEKKFPRAAASNRMLKDNLSLTEIYSRYHDSLADVHRLDVECLQLNTKVECLTIKLQETTTEFERQQIEYRKTLKLNEEITQQMDNVVAEQDSVREKFNEVSLKLTKVESENVRLKSTQKDLARQICNLLNKVEKNSDELSSDQKQLKRLGLSNESIRKELITFDNIVELQENNQKLILKVRELSNKVEKLEEQNIRMKSYEDKISYLERRLGDVEQARQANEEMLSMTSKQKERFKQLYYDAMSYMGKQTESEEMVVVDTVALNSSQSPQNGQNVTSASGKDKKLLEVEVKLQERMKELKVLKEEYNEHRKQSTINFDMLKEQCESVERKMVELQSANSKLQSQAMFTTEQMKSHQSNIAIYKKQIEILEERNQMYDKTIAKHELANKQLKEEAWNTIMQLSTAENRCGYLEMECRRLLEAKKNLETENNAFHRQKMTQSILESSCELAKLSSERSDFEGRILMEKQLEDIVRQYDVLKQKSDEEQNRFTEEIESLKRQRENAIKKLTDEQSQTEALRTKLTDVREQVEAKNRQIKNLSEKLQEALTPCKSDNPIAKGNKKIKDLELQVKGKAAEIDRLKLELQECETKLQSFVKFKSDWEDETKALKENYEAWKVTFNSELQASRLNETNLKSQVDELQQEIRLQLTSSNLKASNAVTQSKIQTEYKEALQKITENNKELRELRTQCHKLKENLQTVERNYANEMLAHSADLQSLTLRKEELNKCQEEMYQLKSSKDEADELLKKSQLEWEETSKKLIEGRHELEQKVEILEKQTMELVDLVQGQSSKLLLSTGEQLNESVANSSIMNRTLTDDEFKEYSSEKLFGVVKYLRREKDIAVTQTEILNIENARLLAELDIQNKRVSDFSVQLSSIKSTINTSDVVSTANYKDLRRTVETLNAVTDSNIHLRAEKEDLDNRVRELTDKVTKLEAELMPLQEKNRELFEKSEEKAKENNMLRVNVDKLRQRVNDFAERTNKNPEDFKRLQNERENLAKMFSAEKENLRLVNEQLNSIKVEKSRLEQDCALKTKQLQATTDDKKKLQDELNNFKQINVRLTVESIEIKANILKKEEELKAIQSELTSTEDQLKDSRNKEMQIRRIAKKYKDSFTELKTKEDEREASKTSVEQVAGTSAVRTDTESTQELVKKLALLQEEINELKKDNENLRKQDENQIITDARNRIAALTETNRQMSRDYQICKNQLQTCEQSRCQHDAVVTSLRSQLEAKIKELFDQEASKQETIARLTRENETLNTRVNQLHRQFQQQGSKPSTSSGTIEKSPSDAARTANVKPMATPSAQQSAPVNLRRVGETPLASIRPMSVQNSRTAAVLPTSQTSNVVAVQGSSTGSVTTALVPPQQQVHTTGNTSTAEAMSSSPTSSHTDYMPATSSAVVVAVPPMASTSAESTQEAESLSVNTNESSSSSSTSSQAQVLQQQQTVALVSPRVEVAPQNVSVPSQQVTDQAASTSGSSFVTAMSSHHQASSSNTVTTSQAGGHKRPRDAEGDSSTGVEESTASEKTSPQNKRTRLGEQTFQGVSESGLDVEYQVPTSSQRDQEDDVVAVDSDDDDDVEEMDDEVTAADVDENFDAENGDTDEIESFGQDDGEGHDIDEDNVPNDNNEVDVDDSSNTPNQSSAAARVNLGEVIEVSPLGQETQQIQTISSGSDAGSSGQVNLWRQAQTPSRQQQQQNLIIQQAYEEVTDDSIVPSTPTLYVARRADGFSEAVSSPHPTVPHGSRFTFGDSGRATVGQLISAAAEGMDDTRVELNLLEGSGDGQSSSSVHVETQQVVNVDSVVSAEGANINVQPDEPIAGPSNQAAGSQIPVAKRKRKTDDDVSTANVVDNVVGEVEVESAGGGSDGVSSEGEKAHVVERVQVEEDREAEASVLPRNTRSRRVYQRGRGMSIDNRSNQVIWHPADNFGRFHQMPHHQQQHGNPHRGSPTRGGPLTRGGRGRPPRRPYR